MSYPVIPNADYDFAGESYADCYPNIHPYPATMIPQLGIKILRALGVLGGRILDPYCGSGSSFAAALDCHVTHLDGCDLNPLALLICQAKFTPVNLEHLRKGTSMRFSARKRPMKWPRHLFTIGATGSRRRCSVS
jgi:hypothetical protein